MSESLVLLTFLNYDVLAIVLRPVIASHLDADESGSSTHVRFYRHMCLFQLYRLREWENSC